MVKNLPMQETQVPSWSWEDRLGGRGNPLLFLSGESWGQRTWQVMDPQSYKSRDVTEAAACMQNEESVGLGHDH